MWRRGEAWGSVKGEDRKREEEKNKKKNKQDPDRALSASHERIYVSSWPGETREIPITRCRPIHVCDQLYHVENRAGRKRLTSKCNQLFSFPFDWPNFSTSPLASPTITCRPPASLRFSPLPTTRYTYRGFLSSLFSRPDACWLPKSCSRWVPSLSQQHTFAISPFRSTLLLLASRKSVLLTRCSFATTLPLGVRPASFCSTSSRNSRNRAVALSVVGQDPSKPPWS